MAQTKSKAKSNKLCTELPLPSLCHHAPPQGKSSESLPQPQLSQVEGVFQSAFPQHCGIMIPGPGQKTGVGGKSKAKQEERPLFTIDVTSHTADCEILGVVGPGTVTPLCGRTLKGGWH